MGKQSTTQCPNCNTIFHIQHTDLTVANGKVRCGICQQIFHATILQPDNANNSPHSSAKPTPKLNISNKEQPKSNASSFNYQQYRPSIANDESIIPTLEQKLRPTNEDIHALNIEPESIESILDTKKHIFGDRFLLWFGLSIILMLLLAFQWLWFNKSELSQQPQFRPSYTYICKILGCIIPAYQSISELKTKAISVNVIPNRPNHLQVDLIIINQANFNQLLPTIIIQFLDLNTKLLKQESITPSQYILQGGSLQHLPPNIAVHLSFSIIDPGYDAVSYIVKLTASNNITKTSQ